MARLVSTTGYCAGASAAITMRVLRLSPAVAARGRPGPRADPFKLLLPVPWLRKAGRRADESVQASTAADSDGQCFSTRRLRRVDAGHGA